MKKLSILSSFIMIFISNMNIAFASQFVPDLAYEKKIQVIQSHLNHEMVKHTQSNINTNNIEVNSTNLKGEKYYSATKLTS